jgi:hypothetical protein
MLLNTDIIILSYSTPAGEFLNDNAIQLTTDLFYKENDSVFELKNGRFVFDNAKFELAGTVNVEDGGDLDLKFSGSDKDFSFFSLVLREDAVLKNRENLKEGNIYFEGAVKGNISSEIPYVDFTFGMKNVKLDLPVMNNSISNLNLSGHFNTGYKQDLSEAVLLLENFSADLPDGNASGTVKITNSDTPQLEVDIFLKTDITGYDKIFKIDAVDNLGGVLTLKEKLYGYLDKQQGRIIADTAEAEIQFENVSVNFPDDLSLDKINGSILRSKDRYILNNLNIISENTDVTINGFADNIMLLLFDVEADVFADLQIESNQFVFPEVFAFDTSAARDFPYTINNLYINVEARTSVSNLLNFDDFPDIDFTIRSLDGGFDELPDISNLNGELSFYEDPFSFNIKFDPLIMNIAGGELNLTGLYTGAENLPLYLKADTKIDNLDLLNFLIQFDMDLDSTSVFNGRVNSSMYAEVQFSREDIVFDTFLLKDCDLEYLMLPVTDTLKTSPDTITAKSMTLNLKNVNYDLEIDSNPLATLSTAGNLDFRKILTSEFMLDEPAYDINISNGRYIIIPMRSSMFGKKGEGVFVLEPWADVPEYNLTYSVNQFEINKFLTTFLEDSILTGKMDLRFDISMKGDDWENMLSHLDGNIHLTGKNLTLYGLDVDRLLERVARSQNFNLVDVSAVLLAGPVGLAVTKGTDLASIVILSPGQKTTLPKLVSTWNMQNGKLDMTDIAFTTNNHRIVAKGYIDLSQKDLDVTIAEVNKEGCIVLSQTVAGHLEDPKTGDLKVLQSLLSPVTNLWNSITGKDCEVFYDGSVEHPK